MNKSNTFLTNFISHFCQLKHILLFFFIALIFQSCKHSATDLLAQKWKVKNNSINIRFKKNNTYELISGTEIENGKWRLDDDDKTLIIIHENNSDSERTTIKRITGDSLILKTRNGVQVLTSGN